jgi:glycosyltransferase 2 family protein
MTKANGVRRISLTGSGKQLWIGIGISVLLLYFLFRKVNFRQLLLAFTEMDYRYLLAAVAVTFAGYYLRAVRWKYLLIPIKHTAMHNLFPATIIGYMANNILPARLGEFVRAYVLGDKEQIDKSAVFATLVLDRLLDGLSVLILLVITLFTLKLPPGMAGVQKNLEFGGYFSLTACFFLAAFLVVIKLNMSWVLQFIGRLLRPFPKRFAAWVLPLIGSFIEGIRFSPRPLHIMALIVSSMVIWSMAVWTVDLTLHAFAIELPLTAVMLVLVFLVIAVVVPASPGSVGTYHFACVYALMIFNLPKEKALSVALVVHAINFFPVILLGLYYLVRDRISLLAVKAESIPQGPQID